MAKYCTEVNSPDECRAVQDYLFSIGKRWDEHDEGSGEYRYVNARSLYWEDGATMIKKSSEGIAKWVAQGEIEVQFNFYPAGLRAEAKDIWVKVGTKNYTVRHLEKLIQEAKNRVTKILLIIIWLSGLVVGAIYRDVDWLAAGGMILAFVAGIALTYQNNTEEEK